MLSGNPKLIYLICALTEWYALCVPSCTGLPETNVGKKEKEERLSLLEIFTKLRKLRKRQLELALELPNPSRILPLLVLLPLRLGYFVAFPSGLQGVPCLAYRILLGHLRPSSLHMKRCIYTFIP